MTRLRLDRVIQMRVTHKQLTHLRAAAKCVGLPLTTWLRVTATMTASEVLLNKKDTHERNDTRQART